MVKRFLMISACVSFLVLFMLVFLSPVMADEASGQPALTAEAVQTNANYVWTLVAAFLVFFMQAGFAMVETGFTRAKNACNIIMKNMLDFSMGSIAYWMFGFAIMFGVSKTGWFGTSGFFFQDFALDNNSWVFAFWMFQVVFAAVAATIVSGAMAERTKFSAYLIYSFVITGLIYPVFGSWAWGSLYKGAGWLENLGFIDFAGSTVVHSIGGWSALAGAMVLGPRIGKYTKEGRPLPIPGHNIPLAALGVFILWFGWYGFNPGSTTAASPEIASIAVNTTLAASAGSILAMITAWLKFGKPDIGMTLNGALAGLVAITAGCANVTARSSFIIGAVAGSIVVFSVLFFEKRGVDDPVGAVSVHAMAGVWGTFAAGLFNAEGTSLHMLGVQLLGIGAAFTWAFPTSFVMFKIIQKTMGLRVSKEEELEGLDLGEHSASAYPDFQQTTFRL